jgi:hypothetical protein
MRTTCWSGPRIIAARRRRQLSQKLVTDSLSDPLLRLFGSVESPLTDIAERHDEYIGLGLLETYDE